MSFLDDLEERARDFLGFEDDTPPPPTAEAVAEYNAAAEAAGLPTLAPFTEEDEARAREEYERSRRGILGNLASDVARGIERYAVLISIGVIALAAILLGVIGFLVWRAYRGG